MESVTIEKLILNKQSTIDKWEELGYIPEGGSMTLPGLGGIILNKI